MKGTLTGPHAWRGKTDTSAAAADSVEAITGKARQKVYQAIFDAGWQGLTLEEICNRTNMSLPSVCARRKELDDMGYVKDSGMRRVNHSGRKAIVWIKAT